LYMSVTHRGQSVGMIGPGIFLISDSDRSGLHQANDGSQYLSLWKSGLGHIPVHVVSDCRQGRSEGQHTLILRLVANFSPMRVISTLLAATSVTAGRLKVTVRAGADPHFLPCRRDHQRADSPDRIGIAKRLAMYVQISKRSPIAFSGEARLFISDVSQPRFFRGLLRICCQFYWSELLASSHGK
jgi:hypothetical protein